jgi:hypothetical protein
MAMTREEMQRLASYGRDGDTMLAHINPQEAALLKANGGSGTINPDTGLPEYFGLKSITGAVKDVVKAATNPVSTVTGGGGGGGLFGSLRGAFKKATAPIIKPIEKAGGQVTSNLANLPGSVEKTVKQVAANPITQVALAVYMPTIAASLGPYLTAIPAAYQTAVAGALASTALQTAQGVPFETALKNATVNAVTSTGAPKVADYMLPYVGSTQVADALTSIGASAAKTAAMGGTKDDIEKNMVAALTGSGLTSALQAADVSRDTSRLAGATAGGAVTGGVTGAVGGLASEYGAQKAAADAALERAKKGLAAADTGTVSDTGRQLGDVTVTAKRDPTLDTSIISPNVSVTPKTTAPSLAPVTVTASKEPSTIQDTSIVSPDVSVAGKKDGVVNVVGKREYPPALAPVTVTASKEPTIQDTDITLPETTVTGTPESDASAQESKPPVDEQGRYNPNLFIYGGVKPKSSLGSSLKTQAPFYPLAGTSGGLTSTRGAGEIESKETGKARKNVWNEASLRLKDALGI